MSVGAGNVLVQQKQIPGGGGGTITGADNGLSVAGTIVELGGQLIQNTFIDLNSQIFGIDDGALNYFKFNPSNQSVLLGPVNPGSGINYLELSDGGFGPGNSLFTLHQGLARTILAGGPLPGIDVALGDIDAVGNGLRLELYDVLAFLNLTQNIGGTDYRWMNFDAATNVWEFRIGDIDSLSGSQNFMDMNAGAKTFSVYTNNGRNILLDGGSGIYKFGDVDLIGFGGKLILDDAGKTFSVEQFGYQAFYADWTANQAAVGDPLGNYSGVMVRTDQPNFEIALQARGGLVWIGNNPGNITADFDTLRRKVILGDTSGGGNNTTFKVDDNSQEFFATNMVATGKISDSPLVITAGGQIKKMPAGNPAPLAYRGGGQTTDAVTPVTILTITPADIPADTSESSCGTIIARRQSDNKAAAISVLFALGNEAGNIVPVAGGFYGGPQDLSDLGSSIAGNINWVTNGANQELQVTGIAATVLDWAVTVTRNPVTEV